MPTPVVYDPSVSHNTGSEQTSYYGQYSCDLLSDGKISCTDGSSTVVTSDGNYVKVMVGASIACGLQRQNPPYAFTQPNVNCTALSAAGCSAAPPTYYGVYCWDENSGIPVAMDTQLQIASQVTGVSSYVTGPSSLSLSSGEVCISQDVFNLLSSPYGTKTQRITVCGNQAVSSDGYLMP